MIDSKINSLYDALGSGSYGMGRVQRMANSGPGLNDYLAMQAATGGSSAIAKQQFAASQQQARSGAYNAWQDMEGQRMQQRQGLLGLMSQREMGKDQLSLERDRFNLEKKKGSLGNQLLGMATTLGGAALGGPLGAMAGKALGGGLMSLLNRGGSGMAGVQGANQAFRSAGVGTWRPDRSQINYDFS